MTTLYRSLMFALVVSYAASAQIPAPRDEEFDLNIANEHIVETNFVRRLSGNVATDNLRLDAGAAVSADRIDLTIRGVTGHVRFKANLDSLNQLFRRLP